MNLDTLAKEAGYKERGDRSPSDGLVHDLVSMGWKPDNLQMLTDMIAEMKLYPTPTQIKSINQGIIQKIEAIQLARGGGSRRKKRKSKKRKSKRKKGKSKKRTRRR